MKTIGSRLRSERERLKLTQEAFAAACDISRRAQVSYESGARSPDANYLEAASKLGVDIAYVVYGGRTTFVDTLRQLVVEDLFFLICFELGFDNEAVESLITNSATATKKFYEKQGDIGGMATYLMGDVKTFLSRSAALAKHDVDADLLATVITQLDTALDRTSLSITPNKKGVAAAMLYRAAKTSGSVDQKLIEETISLIGS